MWFLAIRAAGTIGSRLLRDGSAPHASHPSRPQTMLGWLHSLEAITFSAYPLTHLIEQRPPL